jgi:hypothetical protein
MVNYINSIEKKLLPKNCTFSGTQKDVLHAEGSFNVVAGPGSGKTTVLIAKCAMILKKLSGTNKGICIITHTNVAIDEIISGLTILGYSDISYPHFIGTIQEFFNYFFALKAFKMLVPNKDFRVLDDDLYQEKFESLFNQNKPSWYNKRPPQVKKRNVIISIDDQNQYYISSNCNIRYSEEFNKCISILFNNGLLNNNDTLNLAEWYINKYENQLCSAVRNRFNYVLLDEAQDTSILQYRLLNKIISTNDINFQKYGDPYQALYNIYDNTKDAWEPTKEQLIYGVQKEEIAETTRFGESITKILRTTCIENYHVFKSLNIVDSFSPYLIVYEDNNLSSAQQTYEELIKDFASNNPDFKSCKKNDYIVARVHSELTAINPEYNKKNKKPKKSISFTLNLFNKIIQIISVELLKNGINRSAQELKKQLQFDNESRTLLQKIIHLMHTDNFISDIAFFPLNTVLSKVSNDTVNTFSSEEKIKDDINYFILHQQLVDSHITSKKSMVEFGTVHSVKGETHRSTWLIDSMMIEDRYTVNEQEYNSFELIYEYLIGNYVELNNITNNQKRTATKKALKLAYVALSRPRYFAAAAVRKSVYEKIGNRKDKFENAGWKVVECKLLNHNLV